MAAGKYEPFLSDPPLEAWPMLNLPWYGFVQKIVAIHMPGLRELYCDQNPIETLPWNDLGNLEFLSVSYTAIRELAVWRLSNLNGCTAEECTELTAVDAHGATMLSSLDLYYCEKLSSVIVSGCTNLRYIYVYACALSQTAIDQLLRDLVANGVTDGYLTVQEGNNAVPSADGTAAKTVLLSRGWTVVTN